MSEPTIAGEPIDLFEYAMDQFARASDAATGFRGMTCERNHEGEWRALTGWYPSDPWLGINPDGTRVTIAQYRAARGM